MLQNNLYAMGHKQKPAKRRETMWFDQKPKKSEKSLEKKKMQVRTIYSSYYAIIIKKSTDWKELEEMSAKMRETRERKTHCELLHGATIKQTDRQTNKPKI